MNAHTTPSQNMASRQDHPKNSKTQAVFSRKEAGDGTAQSKARTITVMENDGTVMEVPPFITVTNARTRYGLRPGELVHEAIARAKKEQKD